MNIAEFALKRPVFILSAMIFVMTWGAAALYKLPISLYPEFDVPMLFINTNYPGASSTEIENLVTNPLESELNDIAGVKTMQSQSKEGTSTIFLELNEGVDMVATEQQVRDKLLSAKPKLPPQIDNSTIQRLILNGIPILTIAVKTTMQPSQEDNFIQLHIKPLLEKLKHIRLVEIVGNQEREIHVNLDRDKLYTHRLNATEVAQAIAKSGQNIAIGKISTHGKEKTFRATAGYQHVEDIGMVPVNFSGNDEPIYVNQLGKVVDGLSTATTKTKLNGESVVALQIYSQAGANLIAATNIVKAKIAEMNASFKKENVPLKLSIVHDGSTLTYSNVIDVTHTIFIGILLAVIVMYLFLRNMRMVLITSLALPTSLLGTFLLMQLCGFSINCMSLLALNLAIGILIDDAIVVRENISRHVEMGKTARAASIAGTKEVLLAVIATSFTIMAVFGPIAFLHGIIGRFFREFGLTICFAVLVSLVEAITIAPMLSAYLKVGLHQRKKEGFVAKKSRLQDWIENGYGSILQIVLAYPKTILCGALLILCASIICLGKIPTTFLPEPNNGEFSLLVEDTPGVSLKSMTSTCSSVDAMIRKHPEIQTSFFIAGNNNESNKCSFYIQLVKAKNRKLSTAQFKSLLRDELRQFPTLKTIITKVENADHTQRAFNLILQGDKPDELQPIAQHIFQYLKNNKNLVDVDMSDKPGATEIKIQPLYSLVEKFGVNTTYMGDELRTLINGSKATVFHEDKQEYPIMVRLMAAQRDIEKDFNAIMIPNMNNTLIPLSSVAKLEKSQQPQVINHKNRKQYIQFSADLAPNGPGMGNVIGEIHSFFKNTITLPLGVEYQFDGEANNFDELLMDMVTAVGLGVLFIYLLLACLYESFKTPFTIILVLPLAACGAFFSLFLTHSTLDLFSMIGCVLLLGIATKNSILLVDYTQQLRQQGMALKLAIIQAGKTRLRPILMTSAALIIGMLPVAIGLDETSQQRSSMGVAVIGGLFSSTLLTLVVIPAVYITMDQLNWGFKKLSSYFTRAGSLNESV